MVDLRVRVKLSFVQCLNTVSDENKLYLRPGPWLRVVLPASNELTYDHDVVSRFTLLYESILQDYTERSRNETRRKGFEELLDLNLLIVAKFSFQTVRLSIQTGLAYFNRHKTLRLALLVLILR